MKTANSAIAFTRDNFNKFESSKRKKSAAEQLAESKSFYVKTSSVRLKQHEWRSPKLSGPIHRTKLKESTPQRPFFHCGPQKNSCEKLTPPPVPPRGKKTILSEKTQNNWSSSGPTPPPKPEQRNDDKCSGSDTGRESVPIGGAFSGANNDSSVNISSKIVASKNSELVCGNPNDSLEDGQKMREEDLKEKLVLLLNCSGECDSNAVDWRCCVRRSRSLTKSSLKEGWALSSGKAALTVAPFEISHSAEVETAGRKLTPRKRQKSMPSLSRTNDIGHSQKMNLDEDCSTVRANLDSDSDTASSCSMEKLASLPVDPPLDSLIGTNDSGRPKHKVERFFDSMGLDAEVLRNLSCRDEVDSIQLLGSIASIPSTVNYSNSHCESVPSNDGNTTKRKPVSLIEKNARVIKWIYGCYRK